MAETFTGAAGVIHIGGKPIGYGLGVNGSLTFQNLAVEVMSEIDPIEHITNGRRVRVTTRFLKVQFGGVSAAKLVPLGDTLQVLAHPETWMGVYHIQRNELIWKVTRMKPAQMDFGLERTGNAIAFTNITWDAIRFYDETAAQQADTFPFAA